jgi:hypothetical protein
VQPGNWLTTNSLFARRFISSGRKSPVFELNRRVPALRFDPYERIDVQKLLSK